MTKTILDGIAESIGIPTDPAKRRALQNLCAVALSVPPSSTNDVYEVEYDFGDERYRWRFIAGSEADAEDHFNECAEDGQTFVSATLFDQYPRGTPVPESVELGKRVAIPKEAVEEIEPELQCIYRSRPEPCGRCSPCLERERLKLAKG